MMGWLGDNLTTALLVLGFALLVIEVAVFGFSVFILLFVGLGCLVTAALMGLGLLPSSVTLACIMIAFFSALFAYTLYQPLKRMQSNNNGGSHEVSNDMVGHSFVLKHVTSPTHYTSHRFSGVDWKVTAATELPVGTLVEVVKVEVGILTVAAKA
ncbi:MAG TPA: NfeD family protein [Candidatus Acidoferrum sp.]|nr:NfeD family protein [Candidatus Acidoferrum sp.]